MARHGSSRRCRTEYGRKKRAPIFAEVDVHTWYILLHLAVCQHTPYSRLATQPWPAMSSPAPLAISHLPISYPVAPHTNRVRSLTL
jgi:hypothetical protein